MIRYTLIFVLVALGLSCSNKTTTQGTIADENIICEKNSKGDYELCISQSEDSKSNSSFIRYMIRDMNGKEIKKGSISSGDIKWLDDYAVQIYQTPGNISLDMSENDIINVYLILKDEMISKSDYLKQNP